MTQTRHTLRTTGTLLRAERPWSPAAVALHEGDLYVLEWTNPNEGPEAGWRPRIRKVSADGKVTTLITITENIPVIRSRSLTSRRPPGGLNRDIPLLSHSARATLHLRGSYFVTLN